MNQIDRFNDLKQRLAEKQAQLDKLKGQQEMIEANLMKQFKLTPAEAPKVLERLQKELQVMEKRLKTRLDKVEEALDGLDSKDE